MSLFNTDLKLIIFCSQGYGQSLLLLHSEGLTDFFVGVDFSYYTCITCICQLSRNKKQLLPDDMVQLQQLVNNLRGRISL